MLTKLEKHARTVFEHKPKELHIAVNGIFQGKLKINSDLNEIDLAVSDKEPLEFIEVYSEQQLRLMMLNIDHSLPLTKADSAHLLSFSDNRFLQVNIEFSAQGAEIKLSYQDPTFKQVQAILENRELIDDIVFPIAQNGHQIPATSSISNRFVEYFSTLTPVFSFGWRRFALIALTLFIAVGGWIIFENQSTLSAKAVLEEAEKKKLNWQYQPNKILYWEEAERLQNSTKIFISKRWSNNLNGQHQMLILRYDEQKKLVWGRWAKGDGALIIYSSSDNSVIVYPNNSQIKEKIESLSSDKQEALKKHLESSERSTSAEQQTELKTKELLNQITSQSVKTITDGNNRQKLSVFVKSNFDNQSETLKFTELELEYDSENFQRILYRLKFYKKDGTSAFEEAHLLTARESSLEEFENNELAQILARGENIKYISVEEFAEKMKTFYFPAKK